MVSTRVNKHHARRMNLRAAHCRRPPPPTPGCGLSSPRKGQNRWCSAANINITGVENELRQPSAHRLRALDSMQVLAGYLRPAFQSAAGLAPPACFEAPTSTVRVCRAMLQVGGNLPL